MINVLIADDHQMTIDGLRAFLEKKKDIKVVEEARNGNEVLQKLSLQPIDIVILDIEMPEMDGIETTKIIKTQYPATKILILSMFKTRDFILNLFQVGVNGYILKNRGVEELVNAIYAIHAGGHYFPLEIMNEIANTPKTSPLTETPKLTSREIQITCLVAESLTSQQIGKNLNISKVTVDTHIRNIKAKLGFSKKGELITYAIRNNLCP